MYKSAHRGDNIYYREAFMENTHSEISQQRRRSIMEQLWLTYYNDTLYEKGVITEDERNKMRIKIKSRTRQLESR